ncbi:MAG: response regulator [Cytophagaceae bacterium]|nr:response regulator [Cytophagaceae bacterium]
MVIESFEKNKKIGILYVDDEQNNLTSFKATFRNTYKILTAISAEEGRKILDENASDIQIVITDQRMPGMTGVEFLCSIIKDHPDPIRILLTGYSDIQAVIDAINKGQIYQYISKPWEEQQLKITIEKAFEVFSLREENKELIKSLLQANKQLEFLLRQKLLS